VVLQLEGVSRKFGNIAIGKGAIQEILNPRIRRAMVLCQQTILFPQVGQEMLAGLEETELTPLANGRLAAKP
jgi:hypothetical protein